MLLAHGVAVREDLPLPTWLGVTGAAAALLVSFALLGLLWRAPRLTGGRAGRPLPLAAGRFLGHPAPRLALRSGVLFLAAVVCAVGLFGPPNSRDNLAPIAFYATFWVGLVPASLLFGPVWRVANPLRLVHAGLARMLRVDPETGIAALPEAGRYYPAAATLLAFGWFELVYPAGAEPRAVAGFLLGYAAANTTAAVLFGRRWFGYGDGFEVYSRLLGSLAPLARRTDGRLVVRNPLDGLAAIPPAPGLPVFLVVLIGITGYDGLSAAGWAWWNTANSALDVFDTTYLPALDTADGTQGLVVAILLVALIFALGTWRLNTWQMGARHAFAPTLVPIAAGYLVAHYFSLLVLDGQRTFILASDPFGTGADLFGTAGHTVDYALVGTTVIALVQVGAIVTGHVLAAVAAHDRAVATLRPGRALREQVPLVLAMLTLTVGAVLLLSAV